MRCVKFIDKEHEAVLGIFKSCFVYNSSDKVVINDRVYVVIDTLKYVYLDAEEVEFINVTSVVTEAPQ